MLLLVMSLLVDAGDWGQDSVPWETGERRGGETERADWDDADIFEAWLGEASVGGMGDPREGVDTLEATAGECEQRLVTLEAAFSGEH